MTARSIVQVTLWNSPYLGNFMTGQLALAEEVRTQLGLATHFVLGDGAGGQPWLADLDAAGATWSVLPPRRAAWRTHLDRVISERAGALVHAHFTGCDLQAAGAAAAAGVPCVWHIRTGFNGYPLAQRAKDLFKMRIVARRRVARIVAVSPWLGELARRRGAPGDRIDVVQNAIDLKRFKHLPDRSAARERFGLDAGADVVLGLGWWPEVKGLDVLVEALQRVAQRRPTLQALLVGEKQMRSFLAERLPLAPRWLRLSGFVSDPAWLFAAADLFVSASRHEGQSGAIGEALASRLPVISSDIPGSAVWAAAPSVLTFPSEDVPALAGRLEELLDVAPEARAAAGAQNRRWAEGHVAMDVWCSQLSALYRTLL